MSDWVVKSKFKISRRRLADYDKKFHQKARPTSSMIIFPDSTNQIIDLWRCGCHFLLPNFRDNSEQNTRAHARESKNIFDAPFESRVLRVSRVRVSFPTLLSLVETTGHSQYKIEQVL